MAKLKLLYFGHILRRRGSLEMTIVLGKIEDSRKRGRANMRRTDSVKEPISMCAEAEQGR